MVGGVSGRVCRAPRSLGAGPAVEGQLYLLGAIRARGVSGVRLKDETEDRLIDSDGS